MEIVYEKITHENVDVAIKIQNAIFPGEDGSCNYLDAISENNNTKSAQCWISYFENMPIGVSGVYVYPEHPEDAWLAWYGVLESERGKGYGYQMLCDFEKYAKNNGYKNIRLYTDEISNKKAIDLYTKFGMTFEKYENEKESKDMSTVLIFSKNLAGNKVVPWDNKFLNLTAQFEKEQKTK